MLLTVALATATPLDDPYGCVEQERLATAQPWSPPGSGAPWIPARGACRAVPGAGCARFAVEVGADGSVTRAELLQATMPLDRATCLADALLAERLPPGDAASLEVVLTRSGLSVLHWPTPGPTLTVEAARTALERGLSGPRACLAEWGPRVESWPVTATLALPVGADGDVGNAWVETPRPEGSGAMLVSCARSWGSRMRFAPIPSSEPGRAIRFTLTFTATDVSLADVSVIASRDIVGPPRDPAEVAGAIGGRQAELRLQRCHDEHSYPEALEVHGVLERRGALRVDRTEPALDDVRRACLARLLGMGPADRDWTFRWSLVFHPEGRPAGYQFSVGNPLPDGPSWVEMRAFEAHPEP